MEQGVVLKAYSHPCSSVLLFQFNSQSHLNRNAVAGNRVQTFATARDKTGKKAAKLEPPADSSVAMERNVNNNSMKIAAALKVKGRGEAPPAIEEEDSDDGGFTSPSRPHAKGLVRQGSAVVPRTRKNEFGGRQYRSYRTTRSSRTQRTSHV